MFGAELIVVILLAVAAAEACCLWLAVQAERERRRTLDEYAEIERLAEASPEEREGML